MAPLIEVVTPDPDTRFLLSVLFNCKELNLDTQGLMTSEGMSRKDKGVDKFRRILGRYGYKYENKMVLLNEETGTPALETSEKPTPVKRKAKAKAAPKSKKRKVDSEMAEEGGEEVATKEESE